MNGFGFFDNLKIGDAYSGRRDWESTFASWAKPPSDSEDQRCENAARMIRDAIEASPALAARAIRVIGHGSYRNNTNVRLNSDVDVCVCAMDAFYPDFVFVPGATLQSLGYGPGGYFPHQLKADLEAALVAHFGQQAVKRGNKVILVRDNSYRVSVDAAPTFERRRFHQNPDGSYWYDSGTVLFPDTGSSIDNWPEQHYKNGVAKNDRTDRAFKPVVRILKRLRNEMTERGILTGSVPSFLLESLVWNVPDSAFKHSTYGGDVMTVLDTLVAATANEASCSQWTEVNGMKYLFHYTQAWTREQAAIFCRLALPYLNH